MIGVLFALACWAVFFLSPHNISILVLDRETIATGAYWQLWTAQLTHFKFSQLILNSIIIVVMGLIVERFARMYQVILSLLIAMPLMGALVLLMTPNLTAYRGASGVAAVLAIMAVWFLILETRRFSRGYWSGVVLLLLFVVKLVMETLTVFSPSVAHQLIGMRVDWLIQCAGVVIGLVAFNALHQIHATKAHNQKQKQRRKAATAASAASAASMAVAARRKKAGN